MWLLIILVFAIWVPNTFLTHTTFNQILNNNAVTGLMALCVVIPLAARVFDLSIAFTMTLSGVTVAHFVAHTGVGVVPAVRSPWGRRSRSASSTASSSWAWASTPSSAPSPPAR